MAALACVTFGAVYAAVGAVRAYALRRGVLDVPQARSSHDAPTPRGGGLGLLVGVVAFGGVAAHSAGIRGIVVLAATAAIAAVAAVGWWDDHRSISVRVRLSAHVAAALVIAVLADHAAVSGRARVLGFAWWAVWTVSAINVVNFMDGIDGIIGAQLLVYGAYVALVSHAGEPAFGIGVTLAAGAAGFLCWNWSPARIFLGDAGSGPCGLLVVIAGLALLAGGGIALPRVYLPLYPLFLDATVTLWRRWRAGERVTTPHRSHLYQRLANGPWTHARTAVVFAAAAAAGAVVGVAGGRSSATSSTVLVSAYLIAVPFAARRLDRAAPWRPATSPAARAGDPRLR